MQAVNIPRVPGAVAERGRLRVPIVRADPNSKIIEVDVWRFPGTGEAGGSGTNGAGSPPAAQATGGVSEHGTPQQKLPPMVPRLRICRPAI